LFFFFFLCQTLLLSLFTDQDTAQYLYNALPSTWRAKHSVQELEGALQDARGTGNTKKLFEERVIDALSGLG
jgi:hypothetical protein